MRVTIGARGSGETEFTPVKDVLVPNDLGALMGPTEGVITLPEWAGSGTVTLAHPAAPVALYQRIICCAPDELSLEWWLDETTLRKLWHSLRLPRRVRMAWEGIHPDLECNIPLLPGE